MISRLLIVGGGTAAVSAARAAVARGIQVTLFHDGLPLGGCCLNVGCVPSKYLIRAAEARHQARTGSFPGLRPLGADLDLPELLRAQRQTVAALRKRNYEDPLPKLEGLTLVPARARLADARTVEADGRRHAGDAILIATGSSTAVPPVPGIGRVPLLTNENLFAQEDFPRSVLVLGGGYIALEMAQMFCRLGIRVTLLQRSAHLLSSQMPELGITLRGFLEAEGMDVRCGTTLKAFEPLPNGLRVRFEEHGQSRTLEAEAVFAALGRKGNTGGLNLEAAGVKTFGNGYIHVNDDYETTVPGIYAAGDVLGGHLLVYTASHEAGQVVARLCGESVHHLRPGEIPWVVFTDPQIAGIGWDAKQAREKGFEVEEAVLPVNRWPRFSTLGEERGFLKLYRDPATDLLLGARALCPEGGDLMTELAWIRRKRIPLREVAASLAPYLTLSEGISKCAARFAEA